MTMSLRPLLRQLARSDRGVALVEFALVLPLMLLVFAVIIEGGRMMWSYQTAIAGVRDAARYVGRVVPTDICSSGKTLADYVSTASLGAEIDALLPAQVALEPDAATGVEADLACVEGTLRVSPTPVVTLSAQVKIQFPFQGIFAFAAEGIEPFLVTTITDQSRVFGS